MRRSLASRSNVAYRPFGGGLPLEPELPEEPELPDEPVLPAPDPVAPERPLGCPELPCVPLVPAGLDVFDPDVATAFSVVCAFFK